MGKNTHRQIDSIFNTDRGLELDNPYFLKLPGSYHWSYISAPSDRPGHLLSTINQEAGMLRYNLNNKLIEFCLEYPNNDDDFYPDATDSTISNDGESSDNTNNTGWVSLGLMLDSESPRGDFVHKVGDIIYGDLRLASRVSGTATIIDKIGTDKATSYGDALIQRQDVFNEPAILNAPGSPEKPSYSFEEPDKVNDTGMYRSNEDILGFSTNGIERGILNEEGFTLKTGVIYNQDGTEKYPSYSFEHDKDTGLYRAGDGELATSVKGFQALVIKPSYIDNDTGLLVDATDKFSTSVTINGSLNVLGDIVNIDTLNLVVEDNIFLLNKNETGNGITTPLVWFGGIEVNRGTLYNTAWLFDETNDWWGPYAGPSDTHILKIGNINEIDARTAGEILYVDGNNIKLKGLGLFGSESEPAYSWDDDPNTGIFKPDADSLGMTVGGNSAILIEEQYSGTENLLIRILGDFDIEGNLSTDGDVSINDNIILLNKDETGNGIVTPDHLFGGFEVERGTLPNVSWLYDETNDWWGPYGQNGDINPTEKQIGNINEIDTRTAGEILYVDGNSIRLKGSGSFGSESEPAFSWEDDPDTGIFKSEQGAFSFSSSGEEVVKINDIGLHVYTTGALKITSGTQAERPGIAEKGMIRFETETGDFEGFDGTKWEIIGNNSIFDSNKDTYIVIDTSLDEFDNDKDQIEFGVKNEQKMFFTKSEIEITDSTYFKKNIFMEHVDLGIISSGTVELDSDASYNIKLILGADTDISIKIPDSDNKYLSFKVWIQQSASLYDVYYAHNIRWVNNGSKHVMTKVPDAVDVIEFCSWDNGTTWYGKHVANDFKYAVKTTNDVFDVQRFIPFTISQEDLTLNDFYYGPPPTVINVSNADKGTVSMGTDIEFTPSGEVGEVASFNYTIQDSYGTTATGSVNLNIFAPPFNINNDIFDVQQTISLTISTADLVSNDEYYGPLPTIINVSNPDKGTVTLNGTDVIFTSTGDVGEIASFEYTMQDASGTIASGSVNLNILEPPLIAHPDTVSVNEATSENPSSVIQASTLLSNDEHIGSTPTVIGVSNGINGSVSLSGTNIIFAPSAVGGSVGGFDYTIEDDNGATSTGHVTVNILSYSLPSINALIFDDHTEASAYTSDYTPPTMADIFNSWGRLGNNEYYPPGTTPTGEASAWSFSGGTVSCTVNSSKITGFISTEQLEYYEHTATLNSSNSDDDCVAVIIAFDVIGNIPQVLIAQRSTGGFDPVWGIVYYSGTARHVIVNKDRGSWEYDGGWSSVGGTRVNVKREGNLITATTSNHGSNTLLSATELTVDINNHSNLSWVAGAKSYGYACHSQRASTFYNISLEGGIDLSTVYSASTNEIYSYNSSTGNWVLQPGSASEDLGYPRIVHNPETGESYYINSLQEITKL